MILSMPIFLRFSYRLFWVAHIEFPLLNLDDVCALVLRSTRHKERALGGLRN